MKILLDENCASPTTIEMLNREGHHTYQLSKDYKGISDPQLLNIVINNNINFLVTFDDHFSKINLPNPLDSFNSLNLITHYLFSAHTNSPPIIYILPIRLQGNPVGITQHLIHRINSNNFDWEDYD